MQTWTRFQATVNATTGNTTVVSATTGRNYFIQTIVIAVQAHHDSGTVLLDDGTTTFYGPFLVKDGNGHPPAFYNERGWAVGKGKGIRAVVANGGTVNITVVGYYK